MANVIGNAELRNVSLSIFPGLGAVNERSCHMMTKSENAQCQIEYGAAW